MPDATAPPPTSAKPEAVVPVSGSRDIVRSGAAAVGRAGAGSRGAGVVEGFDWGADLGDGVTTGSAVTAGVGSGRGFGTGTTFGSGSGSGSGTS